MTSKQNTFGQTKAQLYPEFSATPSRVADYRNWSGYKDTMREATGGFNSAKNQLNSSIYMQSRPFPVAHNFYGLSSSHFVPLPQRLTFDLHNTISSSQRIPDSQILFTTSQVPHQFS